MLSKKAEKAAKEYTRKTPNEDWCLARVVSGDAVKPGPYNILPIMGTMHQGKKTAFVHLSCFLLRVTDDEHAGVMNWILPFNPRTEQSVGSLLVSLGWDGRVWPDEPGWPEGKEAVGLRELLKGANLLATMTFPPDPTNGNAILRQEVLRTSADFPLPPFAGSGTVEAKPEHLEKLRKLAEDPRIFGMGGL
jgi:hypothetical protein